MTPRRLCLVVSYLAGTLLVGAGAAAAPALEVRQETLGNGMRLLMVVRPDSPTVACGWVVRAGSADDEAGATGTAHLLEHVMFKGTRTIGTVDLARESELAKRLETVRGAIAVEEETLEEARRRGDLDRGPSDPARRTPRLADLEAERAQLLAKLSELTVTDQLDAIYESHGAVDSNAATSNDLTAFTVTVPANALELWFWLESDRLLQPVLRGFDTERDVVLEERRTVVESDPTAADLEAFDAMFWTSSPYHHPVIGWLSDVERLAPADLQRFFSRHYAPGNITAVLVGGFAPDQALALARKYFGRIPPRPREPEHLTEEEELPIVRRAEAEADATPSVTLRWHTVPFAHRDASALDLLSDLLDGRSGRLYAALVDESGLGTGEPYAVHQPMRLGGLIELGADVAEGRSHAEVESAMMAEVDRLKEELVGQEELERVGSRAVADFYRGLRGSSDLLFQLLESDALGDWRYVVEGPARLQAVSAEDVRRVAREYLTDGGLDSLWISRPRSADQGPAEEGS